jgi:F0F1-type ATP synthase membrane subunit b/b'
MSKQGATQVTGVQESQHSKDVKAAEASEDAQKRAEFEAAPKKTFADLPDDHPMARREAAIAAIESAALKNDGVDVVDEDADAEAAAAEAARKDLEDKATKDAADKAVATTAPKPSAVALDTTAQLNADDLVLTPEMLAKARVEVKIDGKSEWMPASKVLGQYQKGAAADVRLADATKLKNEASAALEKAQKDAQQRTSLATTDAEKIAAQAQVQTAQAATEKFRQASEAIYAGREDEAAKLFSEAVAIAITPATERRSDPATVNSDDLVRNVTQSVKQQLSQEGALTKLFEDYPEIKSKKAFALITDEYINAFVANGDAIGDAIRKAGEAIGEEYGFGKFKQAAPAPAGRQVKTTAPTTRAEKLSAKQELDAIQSGNARSTNQEEQVETPEQVIAAIAASRPGAMAATLPGARAS